MRDRASNHWHIGGKVIAIFTLLKKGPAMSTTVTLSSKNQIVVPKEARDQLNIGPGQELLVLCKADRIVLIPRPADFAVRAAGLHKEIWEEINAGSYLDTERDSWER
jgi:AbrB family looped-hinge helix DNA binding protein